MAIKKQSKGKEVAVPAAQASTQVAHWRDRVAQSVAQSKKATAMLPQASGNFISFKNGVMKLGGNPVQNPLPVILLAQGYERNWFSKPYVDGVVAVPDCYSFDKIAPHPKSAIPQSQTCEKCHWNQWGTDQRQKGKACKEGSRLVMIHADQARTPEQVMSSPLIQARLSVMNAKTFRSYVENVFDAEDHPVWTAITTIQCEQDENQVYSTTFMPARLDVDDAVMNALAARCDEADKLLVQPYPEMEVKPEPAARRPRKF